MPNNRSIDIDKNSNLIWQILTKNIKMKASVKFTI